MCYSAEKTIPCFPNSNFMRDNSGSTFSKHSDLKDYPQKVVIKIVASLPRAWSFSYFWKQRNSNQRSHNNASITWQKLLLFKIPNKKILETFFTYMRHDFSTSFHINVERKNCATAPKYQNFWNYREQSHGKPAFIGFVISKTPQIKSI